jgi:hypothetical protein
MRHVESPQMDLGQLPIDQIKINLKSRDDIPALLLGLQHIYTTPDLRERVFEILAEVLPNKRRVEIPKSTDDAQSSVNDQEQNAQDTKADPSTGRPGMDQWRILVLGTLRLGLNTNYDRLHELANNHRTLRQMLGHSDWLEDQPYEYALNTIKDNVRLFSVETLDKVNQEVVRAGHQRLKKSPMIARSKSSRLMSRETG